MDDEELGQEDAPVTTVSEAVGEGELGSVQQPAETAAEALAPPSPDAAHEATSAAMQQYEQALAQSQQAHYAHSAVMLQPYAHAPQMEVRYGQHPMGHPGVPLIYGVPFGMPVGTPAYIPAQHAYQHAAAMAHAMPRLQVVPNYVRSPRPGVPIIRRRGGMLPRGPVRPSAPGIDDAVIAALTKMHGIPSKSPSAAVEQEKWVQCDSCSKWRLVPPFVDMNTISQTTWTCPMASWDPTLHLNGCSVPEAQEPQQQPETAPSTPHSASTTTAGMLRLSSTLGERTRKGRAIKEKTPHRPGPLPSPPLSSPHTPHSQAQPAHTHPPHSQASAQAPLTQKRKRRPRTEVQWVQCDACSKWRKLAPGVVTADELPDVWNCNMNWWDPTRAFCDAAEETAENEVTLDAAEGDEGQPGDSLQSDQLHDALDTDLPAEAEAAGTAGVKTDEIQQFSEAGAHGKKRRRLDSTPGLVTKAPTSPQRVKPPQKPLPDMRFELPVPGTLAADHASAAYIARDRKAPGPPAYVHGARDYHFMLLLHPPEVWGCQSAARGIAAEQIKAAWSAATAAGVNASAPSGQAKISYRDLISASWGSRNRGATQLGERHITARESHLRWCRSSVYSAPVDAIDIASGGQAESQDVRVSIARRSISAHAAVTAASRTIIRRVDEDDARDVSLSSVPVMAGSALAVLCSWLLENSLHPTRVSDTIDQAVRGALRINSDRSSTQSDLLRSSTISNFSLGFYTARTSCATAKAAASGASISARDASATDSVLASLAEGGRWAPASRACDEEVKAACDIAVRTEIEAHRREAVVADLHRQAIAQRRDELIAGGTHPDDIDMHQLEAEVVDVDPAAMEELLDDAVRADADKRTGTGHWCEPGFLANRSAVSILEHAYEEQRRTLVTALLLVAGSMASHVHAVLTGAESEKLAQLLHKLPNAQSMKLLPASGVSAELVSRRMQTISSGNALLLSSATAAAGAGILACETRLRGFVLGGLATSTCHPVSEGASAVHRQHSEEVYGLSANVAQAMLGRISSHASTLLDFLSQHDVQTVASLLWQCINEQQAQVQGSDFGILESNVPLSVRKPWKLQSLRSDPSQGRLEESMPSEMLPLHVDT